MTLAIGSLFTGAGGLDLAVERATGGRVRWQVENDPSAAAVLERRFPGIPNLGDITRVDWQRVAWDHPVDVLCGGFPAKTYPPRAYAAASAITPDPAYGRTSRPPSTYFAPAWSSSKT